MKVDLCAFMMMHWTDLRKGGGANFNSAWHMSHIIVGRIKKYRAICCCLLLRKKKHTNIIHGQKMEEDRKKEREKNIITTLRTFSGFILCVWTKQPSRIYIVDVLVRYASRYGIMTQSKAEKLWPPPSRASELLRDLCTKFSVAFVSLFHLWFVRIIITIVSMSLQKSDTTQL